MQDSRIKSTDTCTCSRHGNTSIHVQIHSSTNMEDFSHPPLRPLSGSVVNLKGQLPTVRGCIKVPDGSRNNSALELCLMEISLFLKTASLAGQHVVEVVVGVTHDGYQLVQ